MTAGGTAFVGGCYSGLVRLTTDVLLIATNPDADSRLPYLMRLPLGGGIEGVVGRRDPLHRAHPPNLSP